MNYCKHGTPAPCPLCAQEDEEHDAAMAEQVTDDMVACWRINYGLDKRTPAEAAKWWDANCQGFAPPGAVAALGVALNELDALRKDAERYRWLKSRKGLTLTSARSEWKRMDGSTFTATHYLAEGDTQHAVAEGLDETIDAAMLVTAMKGTT